MIHDYSVCCGTFTLLHFCFTSPRGSGRLGAAGCQGQYGEAQFVWIAGHELFHHLTGIPEQCGLCGWTVIYGTHLATVEFVKFIFVANQCNKVRVHPVFQVPPAGLIVLGRRGLIVQLGHLRIGFQ